MAINDALIRIHDHVRSHDSFVVEAGAGSGKTYSLIHTVQDILKEFGVSLERSGRRIVCITYTNVAKDEISERLGHDPRVQVNTIHEFLWGVISGFQKELRAEVLRINKGLKTPSTELETDLPSLRITYGKYGRRFDKGELHHDDVITIARALFEQYPKIVRIASDRFPYIFVDEYQDTDVKVIELLLDHFVNGAQKPVVGLFGDTMQQIYDSKVSDVAKTYGLQIVTKLENYRCSVAVINTINRLRKDIQQVPGGDNMAGSTLLLTDADPAGAYERAMTYLQKLGWDPSRTKTLMLTHRGIARETGFPGLLAAYSLRSFGNDALTERADEFGELFTFVEALRNSYAAGQFGYFLDLLGKKGSRVSSLHDKNQIADAMASLECIAVTSTVRAVVEHLLQSDQIPAPLKLTTLMEKVGQSAANDDASFAKRRSSFEAVLEVRWIEVARFVSYSDNLTPFSTKHGVKGAEFENVLVIIDDTLWNKYKFTQVFTNDSSNTDRLERSRKLLYVCFSRAMNNLAVLSLAPLAGATLAGATKLLGVEKAYELN